MTPIDLGNSRSRLLLSTPIGTKNVRILGTDIVGSWAETKEFTGLKNRLLIEDFLNCTKTPETVLRFTTLYAPLYWELERGVPANSLPSENRKFRFHIDDWFTAQRIFQEVWWNFTNGQTSTGFRGYFSNEDGIDLRSGKLVFRASNLRIFMIMELLTGPIENLRVCKNPACDSRYFIAHHRKQTYCSTICAEWGQSESKKRWWAESGEEWRANRPQRKKD